MNKIHYFVETSAKTGKNVEQLFSDCSRFLYHKYKDRMNETGIDGELSSNSEQGNEGGKYKDKGGHRVGRNRGERLKSRGRSITSSNKCKC